MSASPRKLALRTERLAELTTDDLQQVVAGALTAGLCDSLQAGCHSGNFCTTAMSCGCPITWNCP